MRSSEGGTWPATAGTTPGTSRRSPRSGGVAAQRPTRLRPAPRPDVLGADDPSGCRGRVGHRGPPVRLMDSEKARPEAGSEDEALIFLHIPKAAGQTLLRVIRRQYDLGVTYATTGPGPRVMRELEELPGPTRASIRFCYGHMPFGDHRFLSSPARYLACLRDPVDRAVSHYHYVRGTPEHRLFVEVRERRMTVHEDV